jgi:hypothetical protein
MTDKLKSCPFCGGEATVQYYRARNWGAGCKNGNCLVQPEVWGRSRDRLIAAWNTRNGDHDDR